MTEVQFLEEMTKLLDIEDSLSMKDQLADMEDWDSLSFVSFLATMSDYVSHRIEPAKVRAAETVNDLYQLVKE